jgi:hypothetical protein
MNGQDQPLPTPRTSTIDALLPQSGAGEPKYFMSQQSMDVMTSAQLP